MIIAGKIWFCVAKSQNKMFIELLERISTQQGVNLNNEDYGNCPSFYRHKTLWIHPLDVMAAGIKVYVRSKVLSETHISIFCGKVSD